MEIKLENIEQMVKDRFPPLPIERTCAIERRARQEARDCYRKKLWEQYKKQQASISAVDK